MKITQSITLALLTIAAACALAAPAGARDYVVYSCKAPDGRPAPTDGWSANGAAPYAWWSDGCADGGMLSAGLRGPAQPANQSNIGWGFDSGPAEIRSYAIERSGNVSGWSQGVSMLLYSADAVNVPGNGHVVDYCAAYTGCGSVKGPMSRSVPQISEQSHGWFFTMGCGGYEGYSCTPLQAGMDFGELRIKSASFTLSDEDAPTAGPAGGALTRDGASSGNLEFEATDQTSGVYRAAIDVDGTEVAASSNEDGRCQRVGLAGAVNDFMYRRPCATRRQFELDLAPDSLTSGTHTIRARVYDAAGNALTVYGPRRIAVTSSSVKGAASSTARFVPEGSSRIVANFGKRVRIAGRLETNLGEPIAGAPITVTMTSSSASRTKVVRTLHTDADGRYELTARATANRSIEFSHEASGALLTGSLKVHSQIALRAAKRHVKSLGKMRLTGRVPGERAKRGATVAIKVRSGRGWRTVAVARTDRSGAFKFTYRFRRVSHATLKFRAVALASGDLTVDPRPSRALRIRVG